MSWNIPKNPAIRILLSMLIVALVMTAAGMLCWGLYEAFMWLHGMFGEDMAVYICTGIFFFGLLTVAVYSIFFADTYDSYY